MYILIVIVMDRFKKFDGFKNTKIIHRLCHHATICSSLFPSLIILNLFYFNSDFMKLPLILACILYSYCMNLAYNCIYYASIILRRYRDKHGRGKDFTNLKLVLQTGCNFFKQGIYISISFSFIIIVSKLINYLI